MKIDHPSFFHSLCSNRGDGGSPLAGEPSSLLGFAGNVVELPGELGVFLNAGIPRSNRPALSSIADRHRNSSHTNGKTPRPKTKNGLRPCEQSEAMIEISKLLSFRLFAKLSFKARSCLFGLSLFIPSKNPYDNCQRNQEKKQPSPRPTVGQTPGYFSGGSILLSEGGSIQMGVKGLLT